MRLLTRGRARAKDASDKEILAEMKEMYGDRDPRYLAEKKRAKERAASNAKVIAERKAMYGAQDPRVRTGDDAKDELKPVPVKGAKDRVLGRGAVGDADDKELKAWERRLAAARADKDPEAIKNANQNIQRQLKLLAATSKKVGAVALDAATEEVSRIRRALARGAVGDRSERPDLEYAYYLKTGKQPPRSMETSELAEVIERLGNRGKGAVGAKDGAPTKGLYVEFDKKKGQFFKIALEDDSQINAAVKKAGLWKKGGDYPYFTVYEEGEEIGGGGGHRSGTMDAELKPIPVRVNPAPMAKLVPVSKAKRVKDGVDRTSPAWKKADAYAAERSASTNPSDYIEAARLYRAAGDATSAKFMLEMARVYGSSKARVKDAKSLKPGDPVSYGTNPCKSGVVVRRADEIQPGVVEIKPDDGGKNFHQQEWQIARGRSLSKAKDAKVPPKGLYVEFDKKKGQFFKIALEDDSQINAAVKKAGLWKKGGDYPYFTVYEEGEEIGGGGGHRSGTMDSAKAKDAFPDLPVGGSVRMNRQAARAYDSVRKAG